MLDRRELMKRYGMAAPLTGLGSSAFPRSHTVTADVDNGERRCVAITRRSAR